MKLCKDCAYFEPSVKFKKGYKFLIWPVYESYLDYLNAKCNHDLKTMVNCIDGKNMIVNQKYCMDERESDNGKCGMNAVNFKQKG